MTLAPTSRISAGGSGGGKITIDAGDGRLEAAGAIDAAGRTAGGGEIRVLGDERRGPALWSMRRARAAGGEILVGGDYQGKNPASTPAPRK